MRFILEHSLSPKLSTALDALDDGNEIGHIRSLFPASTSDSDWLLGLRGKVDSDPIVLTADPNIYRNPALRMAWMKSGLTVVFLKSFAALPHWEQAARLVKWWPMITRTARQARKGSGLIVSIGGNIEPYVQK